LLTRALDGRGAGKPEVDLSAEEVMELAVTAVRPYDLVMADPPYAVDDEAVQTVLGHLRVNGWVGDGSIVVLERSSRSPETAWPEGFAPVKAKKYGEARTELATCYGLDS
jgi:16S rRNA (guanine966-N2)-methyltransferase